MCTVLDVIVNWKGKDLLQLPVASGCEYDEQCSHKLENAVCTNYHCGCAAGTSLNEDNTCGKFHN